MTTHRSIFVYRNPPTGSSPRSCPPCVKIMSARAPPGCRRGIVGAPPKNCRVPPKCRQTTGAPPRYRCFTAGTHAYKGTARVLPAHNRSAAGVPPGSRRNTAGAPPGRNTAGVPPRDCRVVSVWVSALGILRTTDLAPCPRTLLGTLHLASGLLLGLGLGILCPTLFMLNKNRKVRRSHSSVKQTHRGMAAAYGPQGYTGSNCCPEPGVDKRGRR